MEFNWGKLLDIEYWFEGIVGTVSSTPVVYPDTHFFWLYLWILTAVFSVGVLTLAAKSLIHPLHPLQSQLNLVGNNITWMGVLGLIWFFCREISVGIFGARFWILVGLCWLAILAFFVIRYFKVYYPLERHFVPPADA
jgi:hypothetical protein